MKLFLPLLLLSLLQISLLHAQESGIIEGTVVDKTTGVGIPEVSVYFGSDNGVSYDATTDTAGRFRVTDVKDGVYGSKYEKTGYVKQYSGTNNSDLKPVRVGLEPVQLRIAMQAFGSIRGRVLDSEGKPMAKATVTLGPTPEKTDDQGQFVFTKLVPLSYKLRAAPAAGTDPPFAKPGEDRIEVVPTWYPSAVNEDQGEPIVVRSGPDVSGLEIRMRTAPVYKVLDENGRPQPRATIYNEPAPDQSLAFSAVNMGNVPIGKLTANASLGYFIATPFDPFRYSGDAQVAAEDGTFEFPSVPRGERRFTAAASEAKVPVRSPGSANVSAIVDHDIDDLQIRFVPPVTVEGSVELAGTKASETPAAIQKASVGLAGLIPRKKNPNGTFQLLDVPPGPHWLVAMPGLAGGYYLDSVSVGGRDVTGQALNLQPGSPPIRVVYKSNGGTVSGTVVNSDGATIEGFTAILLPQTSFDTHLPDYGRVNTSGPGGTFEIESLKPGSYYAFAVDHLETVKIYDPRMAQKIISGAARVDVTEGSAVSVALKVIPLEE